MKKWIIRAENAFRANPTSVAAWVLGACIGTLILLKIIQVGLLSTCATPIWIWNAVEKEGRLQKVSWVAGQNDRVDLKIDYRNFRMLDVPIAGFSERIDDLSFYNTLGAILCCLCFGAARSRLKRRGIRLPALSTRSRVLMIGCVVLAEVFLLIRLATDPSDINGMFFAETTVMSVRTVQVLEGCVNLVVIAFAYVPLVTAIQVLRVVEARSFAKNAKQLLAVPELVIVGVVGPLMLVFWARIVGAEFIVDLQSFGTAGSGSTPADDPATVVFLTLLWYAPYIWVVGRIFFTLLLHYRVRLKMELPPLEWVLD
jgi:hypothetical protein